MSKGKDKAPKHDRVMHTKKERKEKMKKHREKEKAKAS